MATFNGFPIVPMPTVPPAPASIEWTSMDLVAITKSIFTGQAQIQNWQQGWMEGQVMMPAMIPSVARAWWAWAMQLEGQQSVFQIGDPLAIHPAGTGLGTPTVSGSGQTGYTLATTGWVGAGALLPGDYIQIGYRMYCNLTPILGAGTQTLVIWPPLRESPLNGTPIQIVGCQGIFRLKSNIRKWSISDRRVYGMSFDIEEAL